MRTVRVLERLVVGTLTVVGAPVPAAAELLFDGGEFRINTHTSGFQYSEARTIACSPDGSCTVVWTGQEDGSGTSVQAQRYDSVGTAAGTEFRVNTHTNSYQTFATVAAAADGSFIVVWQSTAISVDVRGQRFDSAGVPAGTEFQVNSYTTGVQGNPAVAAQADGSFVVVWTSDGDRDGSESSVHGQRFDSVGEPIGTEFQVNTYITGAQDSAAVAAGADGGFIVVWTSEGQDGSENSVQGRRFDGTGAAVGSEFQVNSYTTYSQSGAAIASAGDGSFVVAWTSNYSIESWAYPSQEGSLDGVYAQRFDSAGNRVGTEFLVNSYTTGNQGGPGVAAGADGSFVVTWESRAEDGDYGVQAQRYDRSGAADGTEFRVNTYTTNSQTRSAVAAGADGNFIVVWKSSGQDGDEDGMFGQLLCVDSNANAICDGRESKRACGDSADSEGITATDALFVLRTAVGLSACLPCVCDADASGSIVASDALRVLSASVRQDIEMLCVPCA